MKPRVRLPVLAALVLLAGACEGRTPFGSSDLKSTLSGDEIIELDLSSGVPEQGAQTFFGPIAGTSHADLVLSLRDMKAAETKGVFVRLGAARMGLATAGEVGTLLGKLRDANVAITCHANELNNATLLLVARGCSSIWLTPGGSVDSIGLAFQLIFGKSLLEKLGVGVDFLQVGKYKGAQEPYTRDEPSPEARETMQGTLTALRSTWISGVVAGRNKPALENVLEDGPHPAKSAKELGLIDEIGFLDEARQSAKTTANASKVRVAFGGNSREQGGGISEVLRVMAGTDPSADPHVALVRATGAITMAGGGGLLGGSEGITEKALGKTVRKLAEDDAVKAVVLRIDSPGGSALASDLLWHELMKLREKKPLIISVGGMAASGGYYLACAGNRIFAEPASIVGSIGVVAGKFSIDKPLSEIGVNIVTLPAATGPLGERATMMSPLRPWDDATRAKMLASMESIYELFLKRIEDGRELTAADLELAVEGRIFGGERAKELRLIDEIGGLDAAIAHALQVSELGGAGKIRVRGATPGLAELLGGDDAAAKHLLAQAEASVDPLRRLMSTLPEGAALWVASAKPLADGEKVVATSPFALLLR